jgi:uncharacterized protein YndB with AHSA1/START domain
MKQSRVYLLLLSLALVPGTKAHPIHTPTITVHNMKNQDFTTTITVNQSSKEVFDAINNVRGWWSEQVEGGTTKLNDEFLYHYKDVHIARMKLTELVPNKKVVWLVLNNHFNFTKDKSEWVNTKIIFEISEKNGKTELRFTHQGLVPEYECYNVCFDAWTSYIQGSLKNLITTGKGQPNPKEGGLNAELIEKWNLPVPKDTNKQNFTATFLVDETPEDVYKAINQVSSWWSQDFKGGSQKLHEEFEVRFDDIHYSKHKLTEMVPNKKIVWLVTDSRLNFLKDKKEWNSTETIFEISKQGSKTELRFTHVGLVPQLECFGDCSKGWEHYLKSLLSLITTGTGQPHHK